MIIREYQDEDSKQVQSLILHAENFGEPFLESELRRIQLYQHFSEMGKVLLAVENEEVRGLAIIERRWRSIVIQTMISHHDYLRQGIGKNMINAIKKYGESIEKMQVIRVDTGDFMDYAQKFYLSCGFMICGFVSHDMSWYNHQVHFVLPLNNIDKS